MPIRAATAADYPVFARLFPELLTGEAVPARRTWDGDIAPNTLVLERTGGVAGYIYFQVLEGLGYIRHVVVDPDHRGQGVGRVLMQEAARRIRAAGIDRWCLNVSPANAPAIGLYEAMGMALQHASVSMRMGWDIIERLPAPTPDMVTSPLGAVDDATVEPALALPSGLLATQRGRAGAHLLLCRQGPAPVGMAVFMPDFPGAYPFRAGSAAAARSLMTAMHPHADPTHDYVQLVLENEPETAAALDETGATRHLEFVHFRGNVPKG